MSDPATPAAPAPEPIPTPAPAASATPPTEVDIPPDGGFPADPAPAEPVAAAPADPTPEPVKEPPTVKKSPFQARIDTLTAQRSAAEKRAIDAERQAELYKAMAEGKPADPNGEPAPAPVVGLIPGTPEFQKAVREEAVRVAAADTAKAKMDAVLKAGNTEYKDFRDRCDIVADLGAGDRTDFMQVITDSDIIPDGHKLIALLAEHPEEAAAILDPTVPTARMTAKLVKFQVEHANKVPVTPISRAPAPITPINGQARVNDEPADTDDMATYAAKFRKQQADKLKTGQPARFARH